MFRTRRIAIALAALAFAAAACSEAKPPQPASEDGADWRTSLNEVRVGITGAESDSARLARLDDLMAYLSDKLGVPFSYRQASDYSAVTQAVAAGQVEMAITGASNYANMVETTNDGVEALVTNAEVDGSLGYYSALFVRSDSPYQSLADLEGHTIAYPDANSTSGYLFPRFEMRQRGFDPDTYFSKSGFAGGHAQAVIAVVQGQYDSGVTWVSGVGDPAEGYTRGNLRIMVEAGQLDMKDIRVLELFGLIPNGPWVVRKDLPQGFKDALLAVLLTLHEDKPDLFIAATGGAGGALVAVPEGFYDKVIALRAEEKASRRGN